MIGKNGVTYDCLEDELVGWTQGAEFRRADLHIHSYGEHGSYDVKDTTMTPENIVDTALAENLSLISITDHNVIGNIERALKHAEGQALLVIPGVELSTTQGHLLVYFPTLRDLQSFHGRLSFTEDGKFCTHTVSQCLDIACQYQGIGVAAHIDLKSGFEEAVPRYDAFKEDLLKCKNLLALEISDAANEHWFTDRDDNPQRKYLHGVRRNHLGEEETYELPKVMNSDAHKLEALGRNARGARKLTRFKMDVLNFESFRIALVDASARTRIEDLIPNEVPRFVGLKLEGGLLNDQVVHFNSNLTCIIGGRGAGKSTMLESLRAASGNSANANLLDSEVWPDRITLLYRDEAGRLQTLVRDKSNHVVNSTDPDFGLTHIPIESYGQGETAETIQHCDKDPGILLRFLDDFIDHAHFRRRDTELRQLLLDNQDEIERLQMDVSTISDVEKAKAYAEGQLKVLKEKEVSKIVELEEKLAKGRTFRNRLTNDLKTLVESMRQALSDTTVADGVLEADGSALVVGLEEYQRLKETVQSYTKKIQGLAEQISTESNSVVTKVNEHLQSWAKKEADAREQIEALRKELEASNIPLDMGFIRKVTKDASEFAQKLSVLMRKKSRLTTLQEERKSLLNERKVVKGEIFKARSAFAVLLMRNLRSTVIDYSVSVKFHEGTLSGAFEDLIKNAMGWRTNQVARAKSIASNISPLVLAAALRDNKLSVLTNLRDRESRPVLRNDEARQIFDTLRTKKHIHEMERCEFEDRPEIKVSRENPDGNQQARFLTRDFGKLSLGQQQSLLLSIMLFSKSNHPLIIDQPEDNLDSEFIYKTFVKTLRLVKERRQVIIVTHNANIAVLGDAELIIPLRGSSDTSVIRDRGSIDSDRTKTITCMILEGSDQAFKKRQRVYGY